MARGMNHVYLIGAITREPELRYTPNGTAVMELTVAGEDTIIGNDGRERVLPWYHRVTVMGKQAEFQRDQLQTGMPVLVEGSLDYRTWEAQDGQKRQMVSVKGLRVEPALGVGRPEVTVKDSVGGFRLTNGFNEVMLVGNLTRDPEIRYTPAGDAVTGLGLAVNESWKDRNGNPQEKAHFIEVTLWRDLAEMASEARKGDPVFVVGRLVVDSWVDKDNNKRSSTKVEGKRFETLTRGTGASGGVGATPGTGREAGGNAPASRAGERPAQQRAAQPARTGSRASVDIDAGLEDFPPEEDLPF